MFPFNIGLYKPQIPPNTGNIARLCVGLQLPLHIIGKASFSWKEKNLKRAGLDHWDDLEFHHWETFKSFQKNLSTSNTTRVVLVSKEGSQKLWDFKVLPNDFYLFGNETRGLPPKMFTIHPTSIRIPMWGNVRSLNLSNSVSIIAYEAIRQYLTTIKAQKLTLPKENQVTRTYYKK